MARRRVGGRGSVRGAGRRRRERTPSRVRGGRVPGETAPLRRDATLSVSVAIGGRLSHPRRHTTRLGCRLASRRLASAGGPGAEGPGKESRGRTIAAFARFRSDAARWTRGSSPRAGRATASWRGRAGAETGYDFAVARRAGEIRWARRFRVRSRKEARVGDTRVRVSVFSPIVSIIHDSMTNAP